MSGSARLGAKRAAPDVTIDQRESLSNDDVMRALHALTASGLVLLGWMPTAGCGEAFVAGAPGSGGEASVSGSGSGAGGGTITGATGGSTSSSSSGAGGSGVGGGGGSGPLICGTASAYGDQDFTGTEVPAAWYGYQYGGGSMSVADELILAPGGAGQDRGAGAGTLRYFRFHEESIAIDVLEMVDTGDGQSHANWGLDMPNQNLVAFRQTGGELILRHRLDGTFQPEVRIPYDATAQRHWRLREASGMTYWETSPDGSSWTERHSAATPPAAAVSTVYLELYAGPATAAPGSFRVDNFTTSTTRPWCAASVLSDDFDDGSAGDVWQTRQWWSGNVSESGGSMSCSLSAVDRAGCNYVSASVYDLQGNAFGVALSDVTLQPTMYVWFDAVGLHHNGQLIFAVRDDGTLETSINHNNMNVRTATRPYDATAHARLRMREDQGTVYFEASADGANWTELMQEANLPFALDAMDVAFGAQSQQATPGPPVVRFDDFNL
jgi:hypothetical protein